MDLTDFDGAHAGEDVWIVGSDASAGMFPDGFWDGRTVIGVNKVPNHVPCRYCVTKADSDNDGSWVHAQANALPSVIHVVSRHPNGDPSRGDAHVCGDNVVFFDHRTNKVDRFDAATDIPDDRRLLVSWSTLGSAMHFAARLGARTAFMVGASGGWFGEASNMAGYYDVQGGGPIEGMSKQTQPIADRLYAMYGTEFVTVLPWANLRCGGTRFRSDYGTLNNA